MGQLFSRWGTNKVIRLSPKFMSFTVWVSFMCCLPIGAQSSKLREPLIWHIIIRSIITVKYRLQQLCWTVGPVSGCQARIFLLHEGRDFLLLLLLFFFPLLCSPCVIPVLGLAQRPGRWFSASEWETLFHTLFSLKNPVINTAWTASSSCVGVPLTLQTCLDSRIPDQLITHAFLSLPRRTYQGVNRHVRRRQHFYHEKKRVGEKKTQTNVFTTQTLVYVVWQVGFINSTI